MNRISFLSTGLAVMFVVAGAQVADATLITGTAVNLDQPPTLIINGSALGGGTPTVTLSGFPSLQVTTQSATEIRALLPAATLQGTYLVTVTVTSPGAGRQAVVGYDEAWLAVGTAGQQGPQGIPGIQGPQGAPGATGPIGAMGPEGARGPAGPAGAAGPQGLIGPAGAAGAQGIAGPVGPIGPAGADGVAGAPGAMGPPGPMGPAGAVGPAGTTGQSVRYINGGWTPRALTPMFPLVMGDVIDSTGSEVYLLTYQASVLARPDLAIPFYMSMRLDGERIGQTYLEAYADGWLPMSGTVVVGPISRGSHAIELEVNVPTTTSIWGPQVSIVVLKK